MFQDLSTGKKISSGYERGVIYYLEDPVTPTSLVAGQFDLILLWHRRLGHPSLQKIRSVSHVKSSISSLGCESCELGKHHRATFQSRVNSRSSSVFALVYSDVWVLVVCPLLRVLDIFYSLLMTSLA